MITYYVVQDCRLESGWDSDSDCDYSDADEGDADDNADMDDDAE